MNEKVVTVQQGRIHGDAITYTQGRSWAFEDTPSGGVLNVRDESGNIIAAHRHWSSVFLDDAPNGGGDA